MINNENFEIYIIDYLDGTLSIEGRKEVENFLFHNPHIEEMFIGLENTVLKAPEINFPYKNKLKKLSYESQDTESLHAITEKLITLENDFNLKPNLSISYPYKACLYKSPQLNRFWKYTIAIASVILLLLTVSFTIFFNKNFGITEADIHLAKETLIEVTTKSTLSLLENSDPFAASSLIVETKVEKLNKIETLDVIMIPALLVTQEFHLLHSEVAKTEIIIKNEIILTSQAQEWKPSGEVFSSKNIFNSIYEAGKNLTEKMKNQE